MHLTIETLNLTPRHPFRISRGTKTSVENVILRYERDGIIGLGEASPNAFYHETASDVNSRIERILPWLREIKLTSPADIHALWPDLWNRLAPSRAAVCAVDCALWDWLARSQKTSLSRLLWNEPASPVLSCVTLGISEDEDLDAKVAELIDFPIIKIKVSRKNPVELVRHLRDRTSARLVVDANAAWDASLLLTSAPALADLGVEFIEQPLPPGPLPAIPKSSPPIFADESCVIPEDIDRLPQGFAGFNIKLVKCGGITPALEMIRLGRQHGLQIMTGCMLESSVLISAAAAIAQRTDYADLDGSWLLRDEPFRRIHFERGILTVL